MPSSDLSAAIQPCSILACPTVAAIHIRERRLRQTPSKVGFSATRGAATRVGLQLPTTPFPSKIGYSEAMDPDLAADKINIQSLIALWQEEEERLRSIIGDPGTSPLIKHQVNERLASVLDQIRSLADEADALAEAD